MQEICSIIPHLPNTLQVCMLEPSLLVERLFMFGILSLLLFLGNEAIRFARILVNFFVPRMKDRCCRYLDTCGRVPLHKYKRLKCVKVLMQVSIMEIDT